MILRLLLCICVSLGYFPVGHGGLDPRLSSNWSWWIGPSALFQLVMMDWTLGYFPIGHDGLDLRPFFSQLVIMDWTLGYFPIGHNELDPLLFSRWS